tara:strand:+ start:15594 stop:19220 length:3627 start_codon:yes stop_codon:yes gene_type:complete
MSDYEAPSTNYANEIDLTTGSDVVDGGPNDLIVGELTDGGAGGLDTFNPSDIINSGGTLRLTATGDEIDFAGASVEDINAVEIRNFADDLYINTINWGDVPNWVSFNTTGDTEIYNIGSAGDFSFIGGPGGSAADFSADFLDAVHSGDNDEMDFFVDGANVDLSINNDTGEDVETGHFIANGAGSEVGFDINGMENVVVTGDAPWLELYEDGGIMGLAEGGAEEAFFGGSQYLDSVDASGFAGDLDFSASMGNGNAYSNDDPVTFVSSIGDDDVNLFGDYGNSDVTADTGAGFDSIMLYGFDDVTVNTGKNGDYASVYASGTVDVKTGNGGDGVYIQMAETLIAGLGKGNDYAEINVYGDATVKTGGGGDSLSGEIGGNAELRFGGGNNSGDLDVGGFADVFMGNRDDYLVISADEGANITAGNGDNELYVTIGTELDDMATIVTGNGDDEIYANGNHFDITTATGDDFVDINYVSGPASAIVKLGGGDDTLEVGSRGLTPSDFINFGGGNDTLVADNLGVINEAGEFSVVNAGTLENIAWSEGSGSVSFDGASTGANAAGVVNYIMENSVTQDYELTNLVDDVTVNMMGSSSSYLEMDLEVPGGTLNFNFDAFGSHDFEFIELTDVGTLNVVTAGMDGNPLTTPTVGLGGDYFTADEDLVEVNLAGNTNIDMEEIEAENLANIDADAVTGDVYLEMFDVADAITVSTGVGNDGVYGWDDETSYDVSTGEGSDTVLTAGQDDKIDTGDGDDYVNSGAENDDIRMGAGDDYAEFDADELNSFDTINGGSGIDTVNAGSSLGEQLDDFFFNWSNVEVLELSGGLNNLTFNDIANENGPDTVVSSGLSDMITLGSGYSRTLTVDIFAASTDVISAAEVTNTDGTLIIRGDVDAFNGDSLLGGLSTGDELIMTANNGTANLTGVAGFEKITVLKGGESDDAEIITADSNVGAGETVVVDASALTDDPFVGGAAGDFFFDGTLETDGGSFDLTSGEGNDEILTGNGSDVIATGLGDDSIESGDGADDIDSGAGEDVVMAGAGNDTVVAGADNDRVEGGDDDDDIDGGDGNDELFGDAGDDTVDGGTGIDLIWGAAGSDQLTGGDGADTFGYDSFDESRGGNASVDEITDFVSGTDKVDVSGIGVSSNVFLGNAESFGQAQGMLTGVAGEIVFQDDIGVLWMDDGDAALNGNDLQIDMTGLASMAEGDFILAVI